MECNFTYPNSVIASNLGPIVDTCSTYDDFDWSEILISSTLNKNLCFFFVFVTVNIIKHKKNKNKHKNKNNSSSNKGVYKSDCNSANCSECENLLNISFNECQAIHIANISMYVNFIMAGQILQVCGIPKHISKSNTAFVISIVGIVLGICFCLGMIYCIWRKRDKLHCPNISCSIPPCPKFSCQWM